MHNGQAISDRRLRRSQDVADKPLALHRRDGIDLQRLIIDDDERGVLRREQVMLDWIARVCGSPIYSLRVGQMTHGSHGGFPTDIGAIVRMLFAALRRAG